MDNKEKPNDERMRKFKKMAEMVRSCCPGEGDMADCCSTMRKVMRCDEEKEPKKKTETGGTESIL